VTKLLCNINCVVRGRWCTPLLEALQAPYVLAAMRYAGKSAIVTGAGSGIGRELVLELVRRGCTVTASAHCNNEHEPCAKQRPGRAEDLADSALRVY
jgi:5,10-methylene-tetrahydrofolate dehydrogenase/methenyl tetrahydrofolate cyclohydrolase